MSFYTLIKHRHVSPTYYKHGIASNMCNHISSNISFKYKNHNFHVNSFTYNDGILDSIPTSWMLYLQVHLQVWPWHKSQLFTSMNYNIQTTWIFWWFLASYNESNPILKPISTCIQSSRNHIFTFLCKTSMIHEITFKSSKISMM